MNKKQISILSTVVNIFLAVSKLTVGIITGSTSIIASGIDSLSDILSSFLVFLGIKLSEKPPSRKFPYGLYRTETIASFLVFLMVVGSSIGILYKSISNLLHKNFVIGENLLSLVIMAFSAAICGTMSYLKMKVGRRQNSISLIADGKHSQIDVFSSLGVFLAILLFRYIPAIDSVIALLIGIYILVSAKELGKEVVEGILDTADLEAESEIKNICKEQEINLVDLKTRKVAGRTFAELMIAVPSDIKVAKVDQIISELQMLIIEKLKRVEHVVVQIKGGEERYRMLRDGKEEKFFLEKQKAIPFLNIKKHGRRTIYPIRKGRRVSDFGACEYLVQDEKKGKKIFEKVVKNPFYRVGRGHGVRFARAIDADVVVAKNIGRNARQMLRRRGVEVREK